MRANTRASAALSLADEALYRGREGSATAAALTNNVFTPVLAAAGSAGPTTDVTFQYTPKVSGKLLVMSTYKGTVSAATAVTTVVFNVGSANATMFYGPTTAPGSGSFAQEITITQIFALGAAAVGVAQTISAVHTTAGGTFGPDGQGGITVIELPG
jgi:hypothetical protein